MMSAIDKNHLNQAFHIKMIASNHQSQKEMAKDKICLEVETRIFLNTMLPAHQLRNKKLLHKSHSLTYQEHLTLTIIKNRQRFRALAEIFINKNSKNKNYLLVPREVMVTQISL
jgi:NhaP-type Na+/H+ and K+/H+ antiporter